MTIICARCNREILPVSGQARIYILHGGKHYHVECVANQPRVVCDRCGGVIPRRYRWHEYEKEKPVPGQLRPEQRHIENYRLD